MHFRALDYLRFFAALLVSISHYLFYYYDLFIFEYLSIIGVEIFFVLSGFVLAPQLLIIFNSKCFENLKIFLLRRWIRTIPLYFLVIYLASIFYDYGSIKNLISYLFYIQNFYVDDSSNFFPVAWSLSVEEWFYLIFSITIFICSYFLKNFNKLVWFVFFILLFYFLLRNSVSYSDWGSEIRRSVIFRLDSILYGFFIYIICFKTEILTKYRYIIKVLFFCSIIYLLFLSINTEILTLNKLHQSLFILSNGIFFSLFIYFLISNKITNLPSHNISRWFANLSYSIYLIHIFFIDLLSKKIILNSYMTFTIYLICLISFAAVIYKYFESPILKLRPKYKT